MSPGKVSLPAYFCCSTQRILKACKDHTQCPSLPPSRLDCLLDSVCWSIAARRSTNLGQKHCNTFFVSLILIAVVSATVAVSSGVFDPLAESYALRGPLRMPVICTQQVCSSARQRVVAAGPRCQLGLQLKPTFLNMETHKE